MPYYTLILAKFIASCALHLMLYPEVARSMALMKYTLNHAERFTDPNVAFMIAFVTHNINIMAEILNLYQLLYWPTVEYTIIYFVALYIIVEIPHLYMSSLIGEKLKERVFANHSKLHIHNKGRNISWASRSCANKVGRTLYRFHRAFYVSIIFYF